MYAFFFTHLFSFNAIFDVVGHRHKLYLEWQWFVSNTPVKELGSATSGAHFDDTSQQTCLDWNVL